MKPCNGIEFALKTYIFRCCGHSLYSLGTFLMDISEGLYDIESFKCDTVTEHIFPQMEIK